MNGQDLLFNEIIKLKLQLKDLILQHYFSYEIYGWIWWVGIACIIIIPFIWWFLVDKKRLLEICLFGLLIIGCAMFLDVIGSDLVLWQYRINILLPISMLLPIDFIIVPVINMIVYQKCPKWGHYMLASAITAAVLSFGLEPFAICIGEYKILTWRIIYSFPIYLIINALAKYITERLVAKQCA